MSNSIAPGSSADVNVRVTALTTNPNVPAQYKTVILKKNLVNGVNTLTQSMMSAQNTKYVVKYDYVLGEDITVPANCILEFDGGSISGARTITGQNTILNNASAGCMHGISLAGTFKGKVAHINWLHNTGENISANMQTLVNSYDKIIIDKGTFYITDTVILRSGVTIKGESREQSIIKASVERYLVGDYMYTMFSTAVLSLDGRGYKRRGNLDNVNDDILYSDIKCSNFTIDFNRHNSDFPAPDYMSIADCTFLYLLDSKDCIIENITFKDYQEYVGDNEIYTNGSKCVYCYNSECCKLINCYSDKCTLVMFQKGNHNEAAFNKGTNSISTWIETIESPYVHIHDNELENLYWEDSMMSTNGKYGIIENNKIINNNGVANASAFTFGHSTDETDASYGIFRNNYVYLTKADQGVMVQNGSNIIIDGNNITVLEQIIDSEESWLNWRYKDNGAIRIRTLHTNSTVSITNNNIYCGTYCGVYVYSLTNSEINISNNIIYGYTNSIGIGGDNDNSINIINNELKTEYSSLVFMGPVEKNVLVLNNTIYGQLENIYGIFENNTIDFTDKTKYISQTKCISLDTNKVIKFTNNTFKNIPTTEITALFNIAGDYTGFFEERSLYDMFGGNIFDSDYDNKVVFCNLLKNGVWKEFYIKKALIIGRGDHTQLTPSSYEEGVTIYDELLHKDILWNGSSWVNVDGSALS